MPIAELRLLRRPRRNAVVPTCALVACFLAVASPEQGHAQSFDSTIFDTPEVAELVSRARIRHQRHARELAGYRANTFTRVEGRTAVSRFAPGLTIFAYETAAKMHWAHPGDVRVDVIGARMAAPRLPGLSGRGQVVSFFEDLFGSEPWFVPGAIGDEIQIMGIPDQEAIHPLANGAERFYRYSLVDSVQLSLPGRTVRAVGIRVVPLVENPVIELIEEARVDTVPAGFQERLRVVMDSMIARNGGDRAILRTIDWGAVADSLRIVQPGDSVQLVVRPERRRSYQATLVAGDMWLDADSLDVVRMSVAFVGDGIWDDDPESPRLVKLEADLEYGLHEGRFWLPLRQVLSANFLYRYLPGVNLPASSVTTFSDYELDREETNITLTQLPPGTTGRRFGNWHCADAWEFDIDFSGDCGNGSVTRISERPDGARWEVRLPPLDSLTSFQFDGEFEFTESLAAEEFLTDRLSGLARISEQLAEPSRPGSFAADWIKVYDVFNFNRVQGPSLGFGYTWLPGIDFTSVDVSGRFGFGDTRVLADLTWKREDVSGRADIKAFRSLKTVEPVSVGSGVGGALRTLFMGRDEADYYLASGGSVSYRRYHGALKGFSASVGFEQHRSVANVTGSWLNDFFFGSGVYRVNPSVREGDFGRVQLSQTVGLGPVNLEVGGDGLWSPDASGGRLWAGAGFWFASGSHVIGNLRTRAGIAKSDSLPQLAFRLGGRNSVRGHEYGTRIGSSFWTAQLDLEWVVSQWWSPVVFADVGGVGSFRSPLGGVGAGVSFLSGILRFDLSKGINPSTGVLFDLLFQIPSL